VIDARAVVVATEGPAAARLLGLPTVGSRSVACVYFAADAAPTTSKAVQLGSDSDGPVNVAVMSNVAPSYAPTGRHLVAVALPGVDAPDEGALEVRARRLLGSWWGRAPAAWRHLRTYRIAHGQPDQRPPLSPKESVTLGDGLFVCGDHRDTASIQGALFSGRRAGEATLARLAAGPSPSL
jgi:phytoene dehydrogenase-like protein